MCNNFQIYVANDGNIFFKKILAKMQKKIDVKYQTKELYNIKDKDE